MSTFTALLVAAAALTSAAPAPQSTPTPCSTTSTLPDKFQLAAVPVSANGSLIALTTTGGGSGLVVFPNVDQTPGEAFIGVANFTYNLDTQRLSTTGDSNGTTVYTSVNFVDNDALSFSSDDKDQSGSGKLQLANDGLCDGVSFFVNGDEANVGIYGWTLCNSGALGWVGNSSAEPCEKVALRSFVNDTANGTSESVRVRRPGRAVLRY